MERFGIKELTALAKLRSRARKLRLRRHAPFMAAKIYTDKDADLAVSRQDPCRARLWVAGTCPCPQLKGQWLQGHHWPLREQQEPQSRRRAWLRGARHG